MEISSIIPHVEALVFAADRPLSTLEICDMLNNAHAFIEDRASLDQVEAALHAISEKYQSEFYPFEVREAGGGWQFLTKKDFYQTVAQINGSTRLNEERARTAHSNVSALSRYFFGRIFVENRNLLFVSRLIL